VNPLASLIAAGALASVHLLSQQLRFLNEVPRSRLLSIAGGISVAFVIVRLLPSVAESQRAIARGGSDVVPFLSNHAYVVVLLSMVLFYGLERAVKVSRKRNREQGEDCSQAGVFWLHMFTFAIVNFLIGYALISRAALGTQALLLFSFAMLLKFIVNDHGLHADHKVAYDRVGRWVLAAAVLFGWAVGFTTELPETGRAVLQAFIVGSVLLNVLKEELPEARESRYWAFALGALVYTGLLLSL
jgi:hypothetical protein